MERKERERLEMELDDAVQELAILSGMPFCDMDEWIDQFIDDHTGDKR